MSDLLGQSIGRYQITDLLGKGGMATVYKAFDTRLERYVAIKFIRPDVFNKEIFQKRFYPVGKRSFFSVLVGFLHHLFLLVRGC